MSWRPSPAPRGRAEPMVSNRCGVKGRLRDSAALRVLAFACRRSLDPAGAAAAQKIAGQARAFNGVRLLS